MRTQVRLLDGEMNAAKDDASPDMWHRRMAHIGDKGLQILAKKSLIPFTKGICLNPYDICLLEKQHRVLFSRTSKRKENVLDLVYTGVCGPLEVQSNSSSRYFVTFIDDFFHCTWLFLMKERSDLFAIFQKFCVEIHKQIGKTIRILRSDNVREYFFASFNTFMASHVIVHQSSCPHTSTKWCGGVKEPHGERYGAITFTSHSILFILLV